MNGEEGGRDGGERKEVDYFSGNGKVAKVEGVKPTALLFGLTTNNIGVILWRIP